MEYAEILFPRKINNADKETLTYEIPSGLNVKIGQLVKASIKGKSTNGIILGIHDKKPLFKTIKIKEVITEKPLLKEAQLELLKWLSDYYFCPLHRAIKLFIPKQIINNSKTRTKTVNDEQINRTKFKELTEDQKSTIKRILNEDTNNFLIHGITGSGKTEIYVKLTENYIKQGRQVLILVPEISLTPQTVEYFEKSIGIKATVINSKQKETERVSAWKNIFEEKSKLVIGSRSAIFAPFQNLALIIIDEEHETSYKQENSPRYQTLKIAQKIQGSHDDKIKIVLGSATPLVETKENHKNSTIELKERIGNSTLPKIEIVDLREEFHRNNYSIFSERLKEELCHIIKNKEQAILFINRRGAATSIVCRDCGFTAKCDECEMPLTYHLKTLNKPSLICHHCGKIFKPPTICPICKSANIRFLGIGTQKIETELQKEFPGIKTLRADKDTTSGREDFEKIYKDFLSHKADVLIGTQMIAKGLHLPEVNLVGVILADIGLNIPDFRTTERNFQLMTQVAGRAGRSGQKGKVIIQTYNPENIALHFTKENDYENFYKYEIAQRKILSNPPFSKLAKILIENKSNFKCLAKKEALENLFKKEGGLEINSYPAYIMRLRGKFRHIILIKDSSGKNLIHKILEKIPKEYIMDSEIKIDIDPLTIT